MAMTHSKSRAGSQSTIARRLRVAELLDQLACHEHRLHLVDVFDPFSADWMLALCAFDSVSGAAADDWRTHYAEAAQLLREGTVK